MDAFQMMSRPRVFPRPFTHGVDKCKGQSVNEGGDS